MDDLLSKAYTDAKVDGVLSPVRRPLPRHHLGAAVGRLRLG
jgi:hypothetical protein